jgi:hypothetical protein
MAEAVEIPIISVHGSTGSPRAEMRRHLKPLGLSVSKGKQGRFFNSLGHRLP